MRSTASKLHLVLAAFGAILVLVLCAPAAGAATMPADADGDGLSLEQEHGNGCNPYRADTDADQTPDGWEVRYSFDCGVKDSKNDVDDDGQSNRDEYTAGTNPRIANPAPTYVPGSNACSSNAGSTSTVRPDCD